MHTSQSTTRLICLPYAGGSSQVFAPWQAALQGQIELVTPELPGRGRRMMDAPFSRLSELVDWLMIELNDRLAGDFSLWGHSMGALLAYELTRAIARRGGRAPRHLFVTGALPPRYPRHAELYHRLDDDALIAKLASMNGTPAEILADRELMSILLPAIRADFSVCETYAWNPLGGALHVPITAIGGDRDPDIAVEKLHGWRGCSDGPTRVLSLSGDHFFLRDHVDAIAGLFIDTLVTPQPVSATA